MAVGVSGGSWGSAARMNNVARTTSRLESVNRSTRLIFLAPGDVRKARVEPISWMRTCEAFAARGVRVTLMCFRVQRRDGVARAQVFRHFDVAETFRIVEVPTPFKDLGSTPVFRVTALVAASVFATLTSATAGLGGRRSVVYGRSPVMLAPFAALRRLLPAARRPALIYETHTMLTKSNLRRAHRVDLIVVNSDKLAGDLRGVLGERAPTIAHIPLPPFNDVHPVRMIAARRRLGLPEGAAIGCYSGKMVEDQVEFLLRTAAATARLVPGFRLLMVGGNAAILQSAKKRAADFGVEDHVIFAGFVEPGMVATYQSAANVLVFHMSERLTHFDYCTPAKGFEYQAIGRPIVAMDIPLFGEVFGRDGERAIHVRERTPEALAAGIRRAFSLDGEAVDMGARARAWVQERTWQRRADAVLELLEL